MIFFSSLAYPVRQIVLGQYIGIGLLVAIGVLGSLIALVVTTYVIRLRYQVTGHSTDSNRY
jgi:uncharacterized membrane protein